MPTSLENSLPSVISSHEVIQVISEFLDPVSMLHLTLTSSVMYCALPRNSSMSVNIWRKYLTDSRYLTNKLVIETSRALVASDQVSRANYKCILAVLVQKNGFMKVSRLKSLCASGKLSSPLLPHKGGWRSITRLDQFALKRASKECESAQPLPQSLISRGSTELDFISRIAGRKGKFEVLRERLSKYFADVSDIQRTSSLLTLLKTLVTDRNVTGFVEVLKVSDSVFDVGTIDSLVGEASRDFNNNLQETWLHFILRDSQTSPKEKVGIFDSLLEFSSLRNLVNIVNLNHVSPLVLITTELATKSAAVDRTRWQEIADILIKHGADVYLCDRKGTFYEPIGA